MVYNFKHMVELYFGLLVYMRLSKNNSLINYSSHKSFLSDAHAQFVVLPWIAVGENGSVHARTAGTTFETKRIF